MKFAKVKTTHHILPDFEKLLLAIEKLPVISRIIPGRISRQQKWSSKLGFKISYVTPSGLKCLMTKGATAQELFVICNEKDTPTVQDFILKLIAWTFD